MGVQHSPQNQNNAPDQPKNSSRQQDEIQHIGVVSTAAQNYPYSELDPSQASFADRSLGNPDVINRMDEPKQPHTLSSSNPHQQPIELFEQGMEPTEAERKMQLLPERMYPIQRPPGVQHISKYAPWSKKASKKWNVGYSDFATLPNGSTLKGHQLTPLTRLGEMPAPIDCPWCEAKSETVVTKEMGSTSTIWILGCCVCCGLLGAIIPCFCDIGRDSQHFCSNCGMIVARRDDGAVTAQVFGPDHLQTVSKYRSPRQMTPSVPPPVYEESKFARKPIAEAAGSRNELHGKPVSELDTKGMHEDEQQQPRYELQATPMEGNADDYFSKDEKVMTMEERERHQAAEMRREKAAHSAGEQHSPVSPPADSEAGFGSWGRVEGPRSAVSPLMR